MMLLTLLHGCRSPSGFSPDFDALRRVREEPAGSIDILARAAKLDPGCDFRGADLRGIDWRGSDQRPYDLEGAATGETISFRSNTTGRLPFQPGDMVIYPKHGLARVVKIEAAEVAGVVLELYVLRFSEERMTLRVPVDKAESVGMRKISSETSVQKAMKVLRSKPRTVRQSHNTFLKFKERMNSGDLVRVAEITRDLHGLVAEDREPTSWRQLYEFGLARMTEEISIFFLISREIAAERILRELWLSKKSNRRDLDLVRLHLTSV